MTKEQTGIKITTQCLALDRQLSELKKCVAFADWDKAKEVLDRIGEIVKGK